jgi:hypothetical protein
VNTPGEFKVYGPLGARICTVPAADTFPGGEGNLVFWMLGLGAMAEDTPKWTPLEEDNASDAGAVLKAMPFDIDDEGKVAHLSNTEPAG